ncbi:MAG TPA: hypothetical protein VN178_04375 [Rubrobacter sp.]|jgi:alpha-glucosidase (family GH31 glycosyl hydrolase)|nr:hypothetical protein [Rubrobacter sp.]
MCSYPKIRHRPTQPDVLLPQFMVGPELMFAPVLDPGEDSVGVYLPAGRWVHFWTGKRFGSPQRGVNETVPAPIGEPAVFYKEGSAEGTRFRKCSNAGDCYDAAEVE